MKRKTIDQKELHVQDALQQVPFATFQADTKGYVFFLNQEWERITGISIEKSLGSAWYNAIEEEDRPSVKAAIDQALKEHKKTFTLHYRIHHPEKGMRHCRVDARPVFAETGKETYFIGYVQDVTEQHRTFERLQQAEKRQRELSAYLHSMISVIEDIIFELDGNQVFRNVWIKDESLLFMPKAQLLGKTIQEVFGEQAPLFSRPVEEAILTGKETAIEYRHIDPAVDRWYRAKAVPVEKSDDPEEYRLALIIQDITERVKYLEALQQEKEKLAWYNSLYDFSNSLGKIASWEYDVATKQIIGTKQLYLIVERDPEDVSAEQAAYEFLDDPSKERLQQGIQQAIEQKTPYDVELGMVTPKGNRKWVRSIGMPVIDEGTVTKVRGVMMDITEQVEQQRALKNTQDELARNNQLLDFSQQLSATGGWEYNLVTGATYWTQQVYAIYEVAEDFDVSNAEKYLSFFSEEDQGKIQECMQKCVEQQTEYVFEVQARVSKHRRKWVRVFGVPILDGGRVVALRGAVMDITQEKEDAAKLLRAKEMAEHAAKAKADFLSVMSHEIRTPLNGIIGIANLLNLKHTREQDEIVNNLLFSANHLLQLINDILDLSKIENNKLELARTEIDLPGLVRSIRNQFASLAESKGVRLVSMLDQEIPPILIGDPVRLSQILNNLVSNAVKYTDQGSVTLSIQVTKQTDQKVTLYFSVKDTGIGIPEELHQAIFEDFKQVQEDVRRSDSGTGLGLAITRRLIELHNSYISLVSEPDKGSEFFFELTFDIHDTSELPSLPRPTLPALSAFENKLGALKVLLVEDNRVNVMVTREQLEYFGIVPHCAVGGIEALELLRQNTYHAAFVDLHMPGMDGYKLSKSMREEYPDTRIIIFTADIMSNVRLKLAKMGIQDILNKPFVPEDMLRILLDTMQKKGL